MSTRKQMHPTHPGEAPPPPAVTHRMSKHSPYKLSHYFKGSTSDKISFALSVNVVGNWMSK